MRIPTKTLAVLLIGLSIQAAAEMVAVTEVYEMELRDLRLPVATTGTLSFVSCEACDPQRVRVTPDTRYSAGGKDYSLADYRRLLASVTRRDEVFALVEHQLASDTIVWVHVWL